MRDTELLPIELANQHVLSQATSWLLILNELLSRPMPLKPGNPMTTAAFQNSIEEARGHCKEALLALASKGPMKRPHVDGFYACRKIERQLSLARRYVYWIGEASANAIMVLLVEMAMLISDLAAACEEARYAPLKKDRMSLTRKMIDILREIDVSQEDRDWLILHYPFVRDAYVFDPSSKF